MIENKQQSRIELENIFRTWERGSTMTLDRLREVLNLDTGAQGRHSDSPAYSVARRAAKFIEAETNGHLIIRWDREREVWRAMHKEEIPSESTKRLGRLRRAGRRNALACQAAIADGIQGAGRDKCIVNMTLSNAVASLCSRSSVQRTHNMVDQGMVFQMSDESIVDLFTSRGGKRSE